VDRHMHLAGEVRALDILRSHSQPQPEGPEPEPEPEEQPPETDPGARVA
jgi:hypothetical protein